MSKYISIDSFSGYSIGAVLENDNLIELHLEKNNKTQIVGSIFRGKVKNVLPGMQAAFVDIGLDKNGYLFVSDTLVDKNDIIKQSELPSILDFKEGDEILVQAIKDPIGTKGARLTTHISIAGKYLVYVPGFEINSISRKITDQQVRDELEGILNKIKRKKGGFIARTASSGVNAKIIQQESKKLISIYEDIAKKYKTASVGDVLYSDGDLAMRLMRDTFSKDIDKIYVADQTVYNKLLKLPNAQSDVKKKLTTFTPKNNMVSYLNVKNQIEGLLSNQVALSSGAYLVINKTEALTVIDVNTGSFVGDKKLESTVFDTNLLAAKEIAKQLRLRNIGGIIIVDFIDMESEEHRSTLLKTLQQELNKDSIKCNIVGMTGLGLVEITRQKRRKSISRILTKPCPYCKGQGHIHSNDYIVMQIRTSLLDLFANDYNSAIIDLNVDICDYILKTGTIYKDIEKYYKGKRIYLVPHKTYHQEFFIIKGDNSAVLDVPDKAKLLY